MTDSNFTLELALSLYESEEKFPIDMWEAGEWLGYSRRDATKRAFSKVSSSFIEGVDFSVHQSVERDETGAFSHFLEVVKLSNDCFKMWGMMAGTEKGKEIRVYFLECEKIAKQKEADKQKEFNQFIREHARIYKPEFHKEFYDELYRVTGYLRPKRGHNPYTAMVIREYVYGMFGQEVLDEIDRVNPIIGYYTYEREKATPQELKELRRKIRGQKSAVTMYTKSGKKGKAKKAQSKLNRLTARLKSWEKPHSLKLPRRQDKNHQFCSDLVGLPSLQSHLEKMVTVMRTLPTDDTDRFYEAMEAAFPNGATKNVTSLILDIPMLAE